MSSVSTTRARFNLHMVLATTFVAVGTPYVLLTNESASAGIIGLHTIALWLVTPPVMTLAEVVYARLAPDTRNIWARAAGRIAALWVGFAGAVATMLAIIVIGTGIAFKELLAPALGAALVPIFSWYALFVVGDELSKQRALALKAEAAEARAAWSALAAQIKPHFLFNSLACLEELIGTDPKRAVDLLRRLADLYRRILDGATARMWPLADELGVVGDFLFVQGVRFGGRLKVELDVPDVVLGARVPATLLLTLVENAVKHGIEERAEGGVVRVEAVSTAASMLLRVSNPSESKDEPARGASYGLFDVRERLRLAFGPHAEFTLRQESGRVVAEVKLPIAHLPRTDEPAAGGQKAGNPVVRRVAP